MPQPTRLQSVETDPTPTTPAQPGTAPRVELRRCDPPRSGRGSGLQRDIDAVLAGVRAEPGTWFQIATWPGASSASGWRKKLGDLHDDLELRALKDGRGSALYAKAAPKAGSS